MKIKSLITGFELTEGKVYDVLFEYDTFYELECDDGNVYCRNKNFFSVADEVIDKIDVVGIDLAKCKDCAGYGQVMDFVMRVEN